MLGQLVPVDTSRRGHRKSPREAGVVATIVEFLDGQVLHQAAGPSADR